MQSLRSLFFFLLAVAPSAAAWAQSDPSGFATVIDIDAVRSLGQVDSDTQVNLLDNGIIFGPLVLGAEDGTSRNIEFNQHGGVVAFMLHAYAGSTSNILATADEVNLVAHSGSLINLHGGAVADRAVIQSGGRLNVTGGEVGARLEVGGEAILAGGEVGVDASVLPGGLLELSGALVGSRLRNLGGVLNISGGSVDDHLIALDGATNLYGSGFRLDGELIRGLNSPGASTTFVVPDGAVLTGVLADGVPFAFTSGDCDHFGDALTLHAAQPTQAVPGVYTPDSGLLGVRAGQVMLVAEGQSLRHSFNAGDGGAVVLAGGVINRNLELTGGHLVVSAGQLSNDADAFAGSTVSITGGAVGSGFTAYAGSVVSIAGGHVGINLEVKQGGRLLLSGGKFSTQMYVRSGADFQLSGGALSDRVHIEPDVAAWITGGDFMLDGQPVAGAVSLSPDSALTGILSDGTPFALSPRDGDQLDSVLRLQDTTLPAVAWTEATVTGADDAPPSLRTGQTLTVAAGGRLPSDFHAGGGELRISGGRVDPNLEAAATRVTLSEGFLASDADALPGSTFEIAGGAVGQRFQAFRGSMVSITGGQVDDWFQAVGAQVTVAGGQVGRWLTAESGAELRVVSGSVGQSPNIRGGAKLRLEGGVVGLGLRVEGGGSLEMSGGALGMFANVLGGGSAAVSGGSIGDNFETEAGGSTLLLGGGFRLNGEPLTGLSAAGDQTTLSLDEDDILTGVLADGAPFLFSRGDRSPFGRRGAGQPGEPTATTNGQNGDFFAANALTLQLTPVPVAQPGVIEGLTQAEAATGQAPPRSVRAGQVAVAASGQSLPSNFNAGPGSAVTVAGGTIGDNLEADGAAVLLAGGRIGEYADAYPGSSVTITDGTIGQYFDARGATVILTDGVIENGMTAVDSSTVVVSGGQVRPDFVAYDSYVTTTGGRIEQVDARGTTVVEVSDDAQINNIVLNDESSLNVAGGEVIHLRLAGGEALLSGGRANSYVLESGVLTFAGVRFQLGGEDITPQLTLGVPYLIWDRDVALGTTFADGTSAFLYLPSTLGPDVAIQTLLTSSLPGDYNQDGHVDAADYGVWRGSFGLQVDAPGAGADGNGDGVVNAADFTLWRDHLQIRPRRGAAAPEPAGCGLLLTGLAAVVHAGARRAVHRGGGADWLNGDQC